MKRYLCVDTGDNRGFTKGYIYQEDSGGLIDDNGDFRLPAEDYNRAKMMKFIEYNFINYYEAIEM